MIKYGDLVQYIKDNHINWNTDLFDVLRGFFSQYSLPSQSSSFSSIGQQGDFPDVMNGMVFEIPTQTKFKEPEDGEYTTEDLLNLFS